MVCIHVLRIPQRTLEKVEALVLWFLLWFHSQNTVDLLDTELPEKFFRVTMSKMEE